jgi:SNF family Na+-dependent transporter
MGAFNLTAFTGMSFFDVMDKLSAKYMLPIGGMLTGVFVLYRWGIPNFIAEMVVGMDNPNVSPVLVRILFAISATVVGFIILNEIIATLTGFPIVG